MNIDKRKITLALIIDMYAHKVTGGFLQPKFVKTYLKLRLPKQWGRQVIQGDFEIPLRDLQSKYIEIGKKVLLYVPTADKVVYLGPEGDWETMMNVYNVHPNDFRTLPQDFSEDEKELRVEATDENVIIYMGDEIVASASLNQDGKLIYNTKYQDDSALKLLMDFAKSRDYTFAKHYTSD